MSQDKPTISREQAEDAVRGFEARVVPVQRQPRHGEQECRGPDRPPFAAQ